MSTRAASTHAHLSPFTLIGSKGKPTCSLLFSEQWYRGKDMNIIASETGTCSQSVVLHEALQTINSPQQTVQFIPRSVSCSFKLVLK